MGQLLQAAGCSVCTLLLYCFRINSLINNILNAKAQRYKGFIQRPTVVVRLCFTRCIKKQDSTLCAFFVPFTIKYTLSGRAEPCPYNSGIYLFQLCEINSVKLCVRKQSLFIKTTNGYPTLKTTTQLNDNEKKDSFTDGSILIGNNQCTGGNKH
ncbi:hypothetical protein, partial [Dysgonomonas macrotermitis]|uniref:hypothetical protein n=1 Tax=Dysgonomonas macrotermitis TaxID=1346286 RepID=UPI001F291D5E